MTLTSTMYESIQQFAPCFTKPSFQTFGVIVTGWLLGHGSRVVTRILLAGNSPKGKTFRGRSITTLSSSWDWQTRRTAHSKRCSEPHRWSCTCTPLRTDS